MVALHVLGNGFDLRHDLPTAYTPHLKKIAVEAERFHGEWECYSDAEDLWSDVEANLAHPDMDMLLQHLESYAPDLLSEREGDRDGIIHEAEQLLDFPLEEFARRADEALETRNPLGIFQKIFGPRDYFLNFNYTHTLERLYGLILIAFYTCMAKLAVSDSSSDARLGRFEICRNCTNGMTRKVLTTIDPPRTGRSRSA